MGSPGNSLIFIPGHAKSVALQAKSIKQVVLCRQSFPGAVAIVFLNRSAIAPGGVRVGRRLRSALAAGGLSRR